MVVQQAVFSKKRHKSKNELYNDGIGCVHHEKCVKATAWRQRLDNNI